MKRLLLLFLFSSYLLAQSRSVTLTWVDSRNPIGVTYSVYRAIGVCSGSTVFSKLVTGLTLLTYTDTTVTPGNYCYHVTSTVSGMESTPSNTVNPSVGAFAPTNLNATVQ